MKKLPEIKTETIVNVNLAVGMLFLLLSFITNFVLEQRTVGGVVNGAALGFFLSNITIFVQQMRELKKLSKQSVSVGGEVKRDNGGH